VNVTLFIGAKTVRSETGVTNIVLRTCLAGQIVVRLRIWLCSAIQETWSSKKDISNLSVLEDQVSF